MGAVTKEMKKKKKKKNDIRRGRLDIPREQAIVERLNKAIKDRAVSAKPSTLYFRSVNEKNIPSFMNGRYLYQPGELEGVRRRASGPIWSLKVFSNEMSITKPNEPVPYYLRKVASCVSSCWLFPLVPSCHQLVLLVDVELYPICVNTVWQHAAH